VRLTFTVLAAPAAAGSLVGTGACATTRRIAVGEVSGVTIERAIVPAVEPCVLTRSTVTGDARVQAGTTLNAKTIVGEGDRVRTGADVVARRAVGVGLARDRLLSWRQKQPRRRRDQPMR